MGVKDYLDIEQPKVIGVFTEEGEEEEIVKDKGEVV